MFESVIQNLFELVRPYLFWLVGGVLLLFILLTTIKILIKELQQRIHQRWLERRARKKQKKEKLKEEKRSKKHRVIRANNWLLNEIVRTRIIIFKGLAGKGKTLLMQVVTMFLLQRFAYNDRKNIRYNKLMNKGYLERREKLKNNKQLAVYTNMDNIYDPTTGFRAQENVMDIITQRKKSNSPAICQLDEIGDTLGKSMYFEAVSKETKKNKQKMQDNSEIKDFARKLRHYGLWLFGTEQDGDDIWKNIRQFGYTEITAIKTDVSLTKRGKRKQWRSIFKNKFFLGWFVSKPKYRFRESLFFKDKLKTFLKMFLPGYWANGKQFFKKRNEIYKKIKDKYTVFKTLFQWEGKNYWLYFNNRQKLTYDTTAYSKPYNEKFDAEGNRKKYI